MRRTTATILATATALAGVGLSAAPAQAATLSCGDTISADVVLDHDLNCTGTALTASPTPAGVVHIDLDGHRISGDGTGTGVALPAATGSTDGAVEITNGTIRGFEYALAGPGYYPSSVAQLRLTGLTLRSNGHWLGYVVNRSATVVRSRVVDSGSGGIVTGGSLSVQDSTFVGSDVHNLSETAASLHRNLFVRSGFSHGGAANVTAVGNTFRDCGTGILAPDVWIAAPTVIEDNMFNGCVTGITLNAYGGNATVRGNTFVHNTGTGFSFTTGPAFDLEVSANRAIGNGADGIAGNGGSGVVVSDTLAARNGGHGISVTGVSDGGGTRAAGNRTEPQCVGVTCSR